MFHYIFAFHGTTVWDSKSGNNLWTYYAIVVYCERDYWHLQHYESSRVHVSLESFLY